MASGTTRAISARTRGNLSQAPCQSEYRTDMEHAKDSPHTGAAWIVSRPTRTGPAHTRVSRMTELQKIGDTKDNAKTIPPPLNKTYIVTPHKDHLDETALIRGPSTRPHRKNGNNPQIIPATPLIRSTGMRSPDTAKKYSILYYKVIFKLSQFKCHCSNLSVFKKIFSVSILSLSSCTKP